MSFGTLILTVLISSAWHSWNWLCKTLVPFFSSALAEGFAAEIPHRIALRNLGSRNLLPRNRTAIFFFPFFLFYSHTMLSMPDVNGSHQSLVVLNLTSDLNFVEVHVPAQVHSPRSIITKTPRPTEAESSSTPKLEIWLDHLPYHPSTR